NCRGFLSAEAIGPVTMRGQTTRLPFQYFEQRLRYIADLLLGCRGEHREDQAGVRGCLGVREGPLLRKVPLLQAGLEMDRGKIGLAADSSCPQLTEHPVADRTVRNSCRGKQLDGEIG